MSWGVLSKVGKFVGQIRTNDISSMTQVLESLDKDHSWTFHSLNEKTKPVILSPIEEQKRREYDGGREDD